MTTTIKPSFSEEQKVYLLTEIQSKIEEIVSKKVETVEQFDDDGDFYEDEFYIGSSFELQMELNTILINTILN
jgi:uncharacterized protein (UPF0371 family)